jgi:exonuclease SbcC
MKPLRIRMQAFGPYAQSQEVDFRALGEGGLFLIHGPTGAGKTSLLDGICFALFGRASGSERMPEGLRSDLASAAMPTEVALEFSLGRETYRIVRRPRQTLRKQRGEGFSSYPVKGDLWVLDREAGLDLESDHWNLLSAGDKKTDEKISELLGMDEEQFRQVVVLPQGQFRKFLSANSDQRESLLETLFRSVNYRRVAEALDQRAKKLASEISLLRQTVTAQLSSLDANEVGDLEKKIDLHRSRLNELKTGEAARDEDHQQKTLRRDRALAAGKLLTDSKIYETRQQELNAQSATAGIWRSQLEAEKRARPVLEKDLRVTELERELAALQLERDGESEAEAKALIELAVQTPLLEKLLSREPEIKTFEAEQQTLRQLYINAKSLLDERTKLSAAEIGLKTSEFKVRETEETKASLRKQILQNRLQLKSVCEFRNQKLTDATLQAETELKGLQLDYHRSQAARLAQELNPESPCPVCGSSTHPHPARLDVDAPSQSALETAEAVLTRARETHTRGLQELAPVKAEIARLQTETQTQTEIPSSLAEAEHTITTQGLKLLDLQTRLATSEAASTTALQNLTQANVAFETARARLEQLEALVPSESRSLEAIKERGVQIGLIIETHKREFTEATRLADSARGRISTGRAKREILEKQIAQKNQICLDLTSERSEAFARSLFKTLNECRASGLQAVIREKMERDLKVFEQNLATVTERLRELKNEMADVPEWAWNSAAREHEFKEADEERSARKGEKLSIENIVRQLDLVRTRTTDALTLIQSLDTQYKVAGRLAEVAAGRPPNLSRVSFQRFVLATQLDEVLEQASRRLFAMSRGQFTLRRSRQLDDKRKAAGLDLEVEDAFTGTTRPTSSLSGGEGFQASLALALGLADVVQSHLGGVRLDAIFVDEGFGTLDSEALEAAMKILAELQAGGRLVGIISHVPELRDQIARRLHVRKGPQGSSIAWETASI